MLTQEGKGLNRADDLTWALGAGKYFLWFHSNPNRTASWKWALQIAILTALSGRGVWSTYIYGLDKITLTDKITHVWIWTMYWAIGLEFSLKWLKAILFLNSWLCVTKSSKWSKVQLYAFQLGASLKIELQKKQQFGVQSFSVCNV